MVSALLAATQMAHAAKGNFTIKANLKNFGDSIVAFIPQGDDYKRDTIIAKNDKFTATFDIKEPAQIYLLSMRTLHRLERKQIDLIAIPNETAELTGDATTRFDIAGSAFYKQYQELHKVIEQAETPIKELGEALSKRLQAGEDRNKVMDEYEEKSVELEKKEHEMLTQFIKTHADWEASAVAIAHMSGEKREDAVAHLSNRVKAGRMKAFYEKQVKDYKDRMEAEKKVKTAQASGAVAPTFTLNDINGKPLSLASLQGKYVVLDFWGSWCIWCIRGIPEMKNYYQKYAGKFEILGIDCNDTEAKWKEAVKKHEMPWLHVYNPRDSKVLSDYAIQGFPTKIIVGPDGKIVKTFVGEDPSFYQYLDELFGK